MTEIQYALWVDRKDNLETTSFEKRHNFGVKLCKIAYGECYAKVNEDRYTNAGSKTQAPIPSME
jgi:hypothetical protein